MGRDRGRYSGPMFSSRDRLDVVPPSDSMTLWFRGDRDISLNSFGEVTRWGDLSGGGLFARDQTGTTSSNNGTITAFADSDISSGSKTKVTSAGHDVSDVQPVAITSTPSSVFDGDHTASNIETNTFDIDVVFSGSETAGTWRTSKRPTLITVNNRQGLLFDGFDDAMSVDFPADKSGVQALFMVFRIDAIVQVGKGNTNYVYDGPQDDDVVTDTRRLAGHLTQNTDFIQMLSPTHVTSTVAHTPGVVTYWSHIHDGVNSKSYENNTLLQSGDSGSNTWGGITFGSRQQNYNPGPTANFNTHLNGPLFEFIAYSDTSEANRVRVEDYFRQRYGLT